MRNDNKNSEVKMNEIKETNKLKPVMIHDQGVCIYDHKIDVGVDPYELIEICKNDEDIVLPEDWTLTQDMVQKMMDDIEDDYSFIEGDLYDVEDMLNRVNNGDNSETEYTNQRWLFENHLKHTIMDYVQIGSKWIYFPKKQYNGVGLGNVTDQFTTSYQNEIDELELQIKDLKGKINECLDLLNKEEN